MHAGARDGSRIRLYGGFQFRDLGGDLVIGVLGGNSGGDQGGFAFDANMIPEEQAVKEGKQRLLDVDNPVVLPVGAVIRVLVTATDVMHSWYLPAAGVQEYAVIGRTNESWMQFEKEGLYYGQCNQICGVNHPFMPIAVKVVSKAEFETWAAQAKQKFATNNEPASATGIRLAAAAQ